MEAARQYSAKTIASEFGRAYYLFRNRTPAELFKFYSLRASLTLGYFDNPKPPGKRTLVSEQANGSDAIAAKLESLQLNQCCTTVDGIEAQFSVGDSVLVFFSGSMSNNKGPRQRFTQSFVLIGVKDSDKSTTYDRYVVVNDILIFEKEFPELKEAVRGAAAAPVSSSESSSKEAAAETPEEETPAEETEAQEEGPKGKETVTPPASAAEEEEPEEATPAEEPEEGAAAEDADAKKQERPVSYASALGKSRAAPAAAPAAGPPPPPPASGPAAPAAAPRRNGSAAPGRPRARSGGVLAVHIRPIPEGATEEAIQELFAKFGPITSVRVTDRNFGFVNFEESGGADRAVKASPVSFGDEAINVELKRQQARGRGTRRVRGRGRQQ